MEVKKATMWTVIGAVAIVLIILLVVAMGPKPMEGELTEGDSEEDIEQDLETLETDFQDLDAELQGLDQDLQDLDDETNSEE